jgi:hypothetical protein
MMSAAPQETHRCHATRGPRPPGGRATSALHPNGASVLGPDTPAGARLGDTGRFLKAFTEDLLSRAEYWHAVFTGRGHAEAGERPPQDDNAGRVAAGGRS